MNMRYCEGCGIVGWRGSKCNCTPIERAPSATTLEIRKAKRASLSKRLEIAIHNGQWKEEQRIQAELDIITDMMIAQCNCALKGQEHWCAGMDGVI